MKRIIDAFLMALGMFCAIPIPVHPWNEKSINLVMNFFPVVGVIIGFIWFGMAKLVLFLGLPIVMSAAILTFIPFVLTGFLHLDGYMDTSDAIMSRRPLEDKLRILKDSHTGAFAVIMLAVLMLFSFSSMFTAVENMKIDSSLLWCFVIIPVASRIVGALELLCVKPMSEKGFGATFKKGTGASQIVVLLICMAACFAVAFLASGFIGILVCGAVVVSSLIIILYTVFQFNWLGISGDLAGHALTMSEMFGVMALALAVWYM